MPDAAFLFMAYGVETDALRRQAEELGVTDSVHFRRFTEDEVPLVFAGSELTVSVPSSDTGRPTSLLEAMAARLPVVLADLPAIHELIEQDDGAEIVPLRDVGRHRRGDRAKLLQDESPAAPLRRSQPRGGGAGGRRHRRDRSLHRALSTARRPLTL